MCAPTLVTVESSVLVNDFDPDGDSFAVVDVAPPWGGVGGSYVDYTPTRVLRCGGGFLHHSGQHRIERGGHAHGVG